MAPVLKGVEVVSSSAFAHRSRMSCSPVKPREARVTVFGRGNKHQFTTTTAVSPFAIGAAHTSGYSGIQALNVEHPSRQVP
jgi:hypothetical protein